MTQGRGPSETRNSVLEYVVAGFGLLLVLATVGLLGFEVLKGGDAPPNVRLEIVSVTRSSGGYLVTFTAHNTGDETAADLGIEGTVARPNAEPETSDVTLDYLPPDSKREGGLFFTQDPSGAFTLRVLGFREP